MLISQKNSYIHLFTLFTSFDLKAEIIKKIKYKVMREYQTNN